MTGEKLAIDGGPPTRREFLHFHRPTLSDAEEREVVDCLRGGWLTTGARAHAFEEAFAAYAHARHAVALSSCTAALHLSLLALEVGPGDEVITSPLTWCSTANVIVHAGARPVFADVLGDSGCIDPADVARRLTPRTKAIIAVDYAGQPCDYDALFATAGSVPIIEDAAHALETVYAGRKVGSLARTTCFSFYATKNMTTGEGGMLTTNDGALAERVRLLSMHGVSCDAWQRYSTTGFRRYQILAAGYKYNLADIQAALGLRQLERVEEWLPQRRRLVERYRELLADVRGLTLLGQREGTGSRNAFHLLPVLVDAPRDWAMAALGAENIGVGIHFPALHLEPFYRERFGFQPGDCPQAETIGARTLSLPLYPSLGDADQEDVARAVRKVLAQGRGAS